MYLRHNRKSKMLTGREQI